MGIWYLYKMGTNTPKRLRFLVFTVVLGSAPSMGTPWLETKHDGVVICVDSEVRFLWFKYKLYYVLSVWPLCILHSLSLYSLIYKLGL